MWSALQSGSSRKRTQVVAIDLGARMTKGVNIIRRNDGFELAGFATVETPTSDKGLTTDILGELFKTITQTAADNAKLVVVVLGVGDSMLRQAELPMVPVGDMRLMLKYNSKNYLQQELPDYVFDCQILPTKESVAAEPGRGNSKCRVLVGGARREHLDFLIQAARSVSLTIEQVAPSLAALPNAFEMALPEAFASEVSALVDIGYKNTTISIISGGELALSRVVGIGGDKITSGLSEAMGTSYEEAEGIKIGLPEEVQAPLQSLLMPLGRELRASIDFFEHQADKTVGQIYLSGGSARSALVVETLQSELMVPCKLWNPLSFLRMALPPQQMGEVEQMAPLLGVAVGAAMGTF